MNDKIIIGISQGDSNSISYEIIIKALSDPRILELCTPVIYGSSKIFGYYKKNIKESESITTHIINTPTEANPKRVNIINCVPDNVKIEPGKAGEMAAKGALLSLERAVSDIKSGKIDALVTAPFSKASVNKDDFQFIGHTEYLTQKLGSDNSLMFLVSDTIRVGLVTNHVPLSKVSELITKELIVSKLRLMEASLKKDFAVYKPRIAVLSLNPHNGDEGLLGSEEREVIIPAIDLFNSAGGAAFGPFSPDGFFASHLKTYDAVLAMYHDQGLIPFKTLAFERGVNFTAGLPIVRTSPDHGVAYDIAGKNIANPESMISAIYSAIDIYRSRKRYEDERVNALNVTSQEL